MNQITSQIKARSDTLNQLNTATQEDDELILFKTNDYQWMAQFYKRSTT